MSGELYEQGLEIRKAVLGTEYVENALKNADAFSKPLQEFVTEFCWGTVWSRDGLPRKTRSLLNIAMLTVLNRPHELKIHVRGAVRNGCSRTEISETLLQAAVYAGIPAGMDGFRTALQVLDEMNGDTEANAHA
jgi:4-carboxymuconolactone decarboxylase